MAGDKQSSLLGHTASPVSIGGHVPPAGTGVYSVHQNDPYAELKAAHAAGKTIQYLGWVTGNWIDMDTNPVWSDPVECYRVKPEEQEQQEQLVQASINKIADQRAKLAEERAIAQLESDDWITWAGGERPVDGETIVEVRHRNGLIGSALASRFAWNYETIFKACGHEIRHNDMDIVAYRVEKAAEPSMLAAEPQSVPYVFFGVVDSSASDQTVGQQGSVLEPDANSIAPSKMNDAINRLATACASDDPLSHQVGGSHYRDCAIQPVEFIEANQLGFLEGCVVKRLARHNKPTGKGRQDIEKAIHELQILLSKRYPDTTAN